MSVQAGVSIFIPTLNAGPKFALVLDALRTQRVAFEFDVFVIDSSSIDETPTLCRERGVELVTISRDEFGHGRTRNKATAMARGSIIVFLSQDAIPADDSFLSALVSPFEDPKVAASVARQLPAPEAHPWRLLAMNNRTDEVGIGGSIIGFSPADWARLTPVERSRRLIYDNVAGAVRRDVLLRMPFPDVDFAEDLWFARTALLSGHSLACPPAARVIHSHGVDGDELTTRVFRQHRELRRLCDWQPLPTRRLLLRRSAGLAWRYFRAAILSASLSLPDKLSFAARAPLVAWRQLSAARAGAESADYVAPEINCS